MSTADDAWQEWNPIGNAYATVKQSPVARQTFLAGYRRALEDAADACKKWRHDPDASEFIERELRGRAVEVGTKDGDGDA